MQMAAWDFRPGLWPSIAAALLLPLLLWLGFWQLDRAEQKRALEERYETRQARPALDLTPAVAASAEVGHLWRRARLRGQYLPGTQFLLDNQVHEGRAGYLVYTPFRLQGGELVVLVNRGWLPAPPRRSEAPRLSVPPGSLTVHGIIRQPVATGLVLEGAEMEQLQPGVVRMQHVDMDLLSGRIGGNLYPYIVRLEENAVDTAFTRDWQAPGFGRERHLGYAFQWFALSATLVTLYLVLNIKRRAQNEYPNSGHKYPKDGHE